MSGNANESSANSESSTSQGSDSGKNSQVSSEANFDPSHLKDSGQDTGSEKLTEVDSGRFDRSHLKDTGQDSGNDGMSAGQGIEREAEDEMEMGM